MARVVTREGETIEGIASSYLDLEGRSPEDAQLRADLAQLIEANEVRRDGDLYFWHETDTGDGDPYGPTRRERGL